MKSTKQAPKDLKIEVIRLSNNKDFVEKNHALMYKRLEKWCEPLFHDINHGEFIRIPKTRALTICDIMRIKIEFLIDEFETMTVWKRETFKGCDTILKFHKEDDYEIWSCTIESPHNLLHDYVQRIYPIKTKIVIKNMFTIIDGKPHFAFGKYKGISVDFIYKTNPNYIDWAINEIHNFDEELKKIIDLCMN